MATEGGGFVHVTLDIWHPTCWTLRSTRGTDAGLLGHGTTVTDGRAVGQFTAYGESRDAVEALVAAVRASSLTDAVTVVSAPMSGSAAGLAPATRDVVVEFDARPSIRTAFTDRGFVHYGPTRHEGGRERRSFLVRADRADVDRTIDAVEAAYDAEIDLVRVGETAPPTGHPFPGERLSPRQREAFELARSRGYYAYPRDVSASELAAEFGVSKTTFLEHLRTAEAKLLTALELR